MANNYCQSSSKLWLSPEQIEPARTIIKQIEDDIDNEDDAFLEVDITIETDGIWFYAEESINPDQVARFAQALLDGLEIDKPFIFSWAYTCSKPRLDEFGGGACKVRRNREPFFCDASETVYNAP